MPPFALATWDPAPHIRALWDPDWTSVVTSLDLSRDLEPAHPPLWGFGFHCCLHRVTHRSVLWNPVLCLAWGRFQCWGDFIAASRPKGTHFFTSEVEQSLARQPELLGLNPIGTRISLNNSSKRVTQSDWVWGDSLWLPGGDQIGGQPGWNGREQESNGHRRPGKRWLGPQAMTEMPAESEKT